MTEEANANANFQHAARTRSRPVCTSICPFGSKCSVPRLSRILSQLTFLQETGAEPSLCATQLYDITHVREHGAGNFLFDVLLARRVRTHVKLLVALDDCISNANGGTNHSEGVDAHEAVTRIDAMHAVEPTLPRPTKARKCHDGA